MKILHKVKRIPQTTEINCGPHALAQLLSYFGDIKNPAEMEKQMGISKDFGTNASCMGETAISYGYKTRITCQNLSIFDPKWISLPQKELVKKLIFFGGQVQDNYLKFLVNSHANYLKMGGSVKFLPLSREMLVEKVKIRPVLIGFCLTYLWGSQRPNIAKINYRDNHFAVLNGYDSASDKFSIVDPYHTISFSKSGRYRVKTDKLIAAMYLAENTHDCSILEIWK